MDEYDKNTLIKELLQRVADLEEKVRALEAQPRQIVNYNFPPQPYWNPLQPQIWCGSGQVNTGGQIT